MASLKDTEKRNVEDAFLNFMKREKLFIKVDIVHIFGYDEYGLHVEHMHDNVDSHNSKTKFNKEYLWSNKEKQIINYKNYDFSNCDFSFYFKFIRENQDILNAKETAFLLKNKLFTSTSNVVDELVSLNNNEVNKHFFTHNFLISNLDLFSENFKRFSFTPEQEKIFFNMLENSVQFKKDGFRNKVYRLVKNKFINPEFFVERFPNILNSDYLGLFTSKQIPSFYLDVDKKNLYDFNLMREYSSKEMFSLLNLILVNISKYGDLFGINNYVFHRGQDIPSEKTFSICFHGESDSDLKVDLLSNVFNKYVEVILKENTVGGAVDQMKSGIVLEKIILEESLPKKSLEHKKNKV